MDFTLNEEQQMLADTMARFVQTEYEFEARRKRLAGGPSDALARQMASVRGIAIDRAVHKLERQISGSKGSAQSKQRRSGETVRTGISGEAQEPPLEAES